MKINLKSILLVGIALEVLLFAYCWFTYQPNWAEVFRFAARYSGRISLGVYLYCFYLFFNDLRETKSIQLSQNYQNWILVFAVLHLIHFYFLASNVYFNDIKLVPYRLLGGFLGYMLILVYPFLLLKNKAGKYLHFFYFFYLAIVFILTYLARIKGNFENTAPSIIHYVGMILSVLVIILDGYLLMLKKN